MGFPGQNINPGSIPQRALGLAPPTKGGDAVTYAFLRDYVRGQARCGTLVVTDPNAGQGEGDPEVGDIDTDYLAALNGLSPGDPPLLSSGEGDPEVGNPAFDFLAALLGTPTTNP